MGMSLVAKKIDGVWMVKGSADHDSNYQRISYFKKVESAGDFVDLLLQRYPNSTIQILGE